MILAPGNLSKKIRLNGFFLFLLYLYGCQPQSTEPAAQLNAVTQADSLFSMAEKQTGANGDMARLYLSGALDALGSDPGVEALARYHMVKGRIYYYEDQYAYSLRHLDSALTFLEGISMGDRLADCYFFQASTLKLMGNYPAALAQNLEAIALYKEMDNKRFLSRSFNFHSTVYLEQGSFGQALAYVEKAAALSTLNPVSLQNANVLSTMGKIQKASGDLEAAGRHIGKAYAIRQHCANKRHIASSLIQMAELDYLKGAYPTGLLHLAEAETIYLDLDEKTGLFNVHYFMARIQLANGLNDEALEHAHQALNIGVQLANNALKESITRILCEIYTSLGDYRSALNFHKQYMEYHNELMSMDKNRLLAGIEYAHALENQTLDNALLLERNRVKKQQVFLQLLLIGALLMCIVALLIVQQLRRKNNHNKQTLLENEKLLLENDLRVRNKELTGKTMELLHNNETMQSLAGRIEQLKNKDSRKEIESILQELKMKNREHVWDEFHTAFNHVHRDFYDQLFGICPDLSGTEIKIAALLKLNLSTKEIAAISYKSESAVKTARHRLRHKLNLDQGENLIAFLMKL